MDFEPTPPQDPFNLQESRRERSTRRARSRRRLVVGLVITVVVLGGAGTGAYFLLTRGDTGSAQVTTTSGGTTGTTSPTTTVDTLVPGTGTSTTSTTQPNLAPQQLDISANPEFVKLAITLQDGTSLTGKTPFSQEVPGGKIRIEFSKAGYNTTTREFTLDQASTMKVWLDPEGQLFESVVRFKCGGGPAQVAFSPDGRELWVTLLNGDGLEVYNPSTGAKTGEVDLDEGGAVELVFTSDGQTLYASQMRTALVYEIDRVARKVTRTFETGGASPKVLLLSPDEKTLWAANWDSDDISEIDLSSGAVTRRIPTVGAPRGLYATADGKRLYVAGYETGELQSIDLATGTGTVIYTATGALWHLVGDDAQGLLYADDVDSNGVYVIDLATDQVRKLSDTDQRPNTMALSPDGKVLYVSNRGKDNSTNTKLAGPERGSVLAIDISSGVILDAIVGGNQCTGLGVSSDGTLLAFSSFLDDHIRVYAIPSYETLLAGEGGRADERLEDIVKD